MSNITVLVRNGELKHDWSGCSYNGHTLQHNKNQITTVDSETNPTEIEMKCMMCEEAHSAQIRTNDGPQIDMLYCYICGMFADSCPMPKINVADSAKRAWREHKGQPLTDDVRVAMTKEIQQACDEKIHVSFE